MGTPDGEPRSSFQLRQLEMAEFKDGEGYHFAVDVDGTVHNGRRHDAVAHYNDEYDWDSVIVRWVGSTDISPRQAKAINQLVQQLRGAYSLTTVHTIK